LKNINIKLSKENSKEERAIKFLEDKPLKYIFLEAMELYIDRYESMKSGAPVKEVLSNNSNDKDTEEISQFFRGKQT